jgi:hypothetical protein
MKSIALLVPFLVSVSALVCEDFNNPQLRTVVSRLVPFPVTTIVNPLHILEQDIVSCKWCPNANAIGEFHECNHAYTVCMSLVSKQGISSLPDFLACHGAIQACNVACNSGVKS